MCHRKHEPPVFKLPVLQYTVVLFITYHPPQHIRIEMWNDITAIIYFIFLLGVSLGKKNRVSNKKNTRYALLTNFAAQQQQNRRLCERRAFNKKKMRVGPFLQIFRLYSKPTVKNMATQGTWPLRGPDFLYT